MSSRIQQIEEEFGFNDVQIKQIGDVVKKVLTSIKKPVISITRVSINEACELLNIDKTTFYDYKKRGLLDVRKNKANKPMVSIKSIEDLINAR